MSAPHKFLVSVHLRGAGSNWGSDLIPQLVEAYNLRDALRIAAELPLTAWFPKEEENDAP